MKILLDTFRAFTISIVLVPVALFITAYERVTEVDTNFAEVEINMKTHCCFVILLKGNRYISHKKRDSMLETVN